MSSGFVSLGKVDFPAWSMELELSSVSRLSFSPSSFSKLPVTTFATSGFVFCWLSLSSILPSKDFAALGVTPFFSSLSIVRSLLDAFIIASSRTISFKEFSLSGIFVLFFDITYFYTVSIVHILII